MKKNIILAVYRNFLGMPPASLG